MCSHELHERRHEIHGRDADRQSERQPTHEAFQKTTARADETTAPMTMTSALRVAQVV